ncbi:methyl-accepting chemotaxis protein [Marivivens aquimaris]|uniref:methyl-accepting chemotaxis protein n=1 Tax=Marivivens aquimaris TaxID=2774876 RepID=UPI001D16886C|nr:methyl-accepting chemotaxis protein [Marivivens aquimaris]
MTEKSPTMTPELDNIIGDMSAQNLLDLIGTPVTIADENMVIRYVNSSATKLFKDVEQDIRKDLPNFSADKLVGTCVDDFHKNPAHQRRMIGGLKETYHGGLSVGGHHYAFMGTPRFNADGKLIGVFVEWQDQTSVVNNANEGKALAAEFEMMARKHTEGFISVSADSTKFGEEFSRVVDAVNEMVTAHIDTKKKAIGFVTELANGNFDADLEKFPGEKSFINEALESVRERFRSVVREADRMGQSILRGDLDVQANTEGFSGEFRTLLGTLDGISNHVSAVIEEIENLSNSIVQGRLDVNVDTRRFEGAYGSIMRAFEGSFGSLNSAFNTINTQVGQIVSTVDQMSRASQALATNSQIQSSSVDEVSSSTEETESQVKSNATAAGSARDLVVGASVVASDGKVKIGEMVNAMDGIRASSQDIAKIIKVIDEIAFQTNLLALNAAVEAARAGQHGRGFAVVAQEVRNLAGRSAKAARETSELIESASSRVQEGVRIADETSSAFTSIADDIEKVRTLVGDIATASDEQSRGVAQINVAVGEIAKSALSTSQQADELAASAAQMQAATENVRSEIARFSLRAMNTSTAIPAGLEGLPPEMMAQIQAMLANQGNANMAPAPAAKTGTGGNRNSDRDERGFGHF